MPKPANISRKEMKRYLADIIYVCHITLSLFFCTIDKTTLNYEITLFATSCTARRHEQSKFSAENYANRANDVIS